MRVLKEREKNILTQGGFGLTASAKVLFCSLAAVSCLSLNIYYALITSLVCIATSIFLKNNLLTVNAFLMVPVIFAVENSGHAALSLALVFAALLVLLFSFLPVREIPESVKLGAAIGLAFSVTALLTTYYFGIGATGSYTFQILKNYRYLGFHPNWRGVFYGTITLFAMITYPFKFKKLSQYLPAEFVSVLMPLLLNLVLNPEAYSTPILELGSLSNINLLSSAKSFFPLSAFFSEPNAADAVVAFKSGLAMAVVWLLLKSEEKKASLATAASDAASALLGGLPVSQNKIKSYSPISAVTALCATVLACVFLSPLFARIPIHSLAVVLIVSAWKTVPFSKIGKLFGLHRPFDLFAFFAVILSFVFFDPFIASGVCVLLVLVGRRVK